MGLRKVHQFDGIKIGCTYQMRPRFFRAMLKIIPWPFDSTFYTHHSFVLQLSIKYAKFETLDMVGDDNQNIIEWILVNEMRRVS